MLLLVAVDHNQLREMASETVDIIHWPLSNTFYRAVPPERHIFITNRWASAGNRTPKIHRRGNRIADAATMNDIFYFNSIRYYKRYVNLNRKKHKIVMHSRLMINFTQWAMVLEDIEY